MEQINKEPKIPEILDAFKIFDGVYKREQLDTAVELKEEITPYLIKILEDILSDPTTYIEDTNLYDHIYAVILLGHFKESKAHKIIIDLFSLPDDIPDKLFGDLTTMTLPMILLNTCGGSISLIKSMVLNKKADVYCRASALHAMVYAVVEGIVSREEVITFFGTLFTGNEADKTSDFWSLLACFVCDLYPEELMETIKQGYEDNLIMPGVIGYEAFERDLELGKEKCLEKLKTEFKNNSLDDLHSIISRWPCFSEEPKRSLISDDSSDVISVTSHGKPSSKSQKKKTKSKKKKRKLSKASKRKNRR